MINLIDQLQSLKLEKSYFIYIRFCFKIIKILENVDNDYVQETLQLAKSFWFDSNSLVSERDLINRRVKILEYISEKNMSYDIDMVPELKFSILPLWTQPPSDDIEDSLDWAFTLIKTIKIDDDVVFTKLNEALLENDI